MPRYHFHLWNSIGRVPDEEGEELHDRVAARVRAIENIRSILKGDIDEGLIDLGGYIDIADEAGAVLERVDCAEAVALRLAEQGR